MGWGGEWTWPWGSTSQAFHPLPFLKCHSGCQSSLCPRGYMPGHQGRVFPHRRLLGGSTDLTGTKLGSKAPDLRWLSPNHSFSSNFQILGREFNCPSLGLGWKPSAVARGRLTMNKHGLWAYPHVPSSFQGQAAPPSGPYLLLLWISVIFISSKVWEVKRGL